MYDIDTIRTMYLKHAVEITEHFYRRIKERVIKFPDVKNAIVYGEIIEQALDAYPHPSVLILGFTRSNTPLHVAVGVDNDKLILITAYCPALEIWEADYKTRRAVE